MSYNSVHRCADVNRLVHKLKDEEKKESGFIYVGETIGLFAHQLALLLTSFTWLQLSFMLLIKSKHRLRERAEGSGY